MRLQILQIYLLVDGEICSIFYACLFCIYVILSVISIVIDSLISLIVWKIFFFVTSTFNVLRKAGKHLLSDDGIA